MKSPTRAFWENIQTAVTVRKTQSLICRLWLNISSFIKVRFSQKLLLRRRFRLSKNELPPEPDLPRKAYSQKEVEAKGYHRRCVVSR